MGSGVVQMGADTVNGVTDGAIGTVNLPTFAWNTLAGAGNQVMECVGSGVVPGYGGGEYFPLIKPLPQPDYSHNVFLPMPASTHEMHKQVLGTLALVGVGEVAAPSRVAEGLSVARSATIPAPSAATRQTFATGSEWYEYYAGKYGRRTLIG